MHEELTGRGRHLLLPETDLLTPLPSPPSVVQLGGVWGSPPVEQSVTMQVCPYIVPTRQGKPCLLFRACRYSSCLNLTSRHEVIARSLGRAMSTLVVQQLHRSRLRRSNKSYLSGQLLPPPVRRLQCPACLSPRAATCVLPRSRTTSAAAFKSGAVELGIGRPPARPGPRQLGVSGGARGLGTGDIEREGTASGEGKCISPSPGGGPGG